VALWPDRRHDLPALTAGPGCSHRDSFERALDPPSVAATEAKTAGFLKGVQDVYKAHNGGGTWLFGDAIGPTVLDGHVGPLLARLLGNEERRDMVPEELRQYLGGIKDLDEWTSVMHDRPTTYNPSMGPVEGMPL
jgi:hypothetical protein